jgi:glycine cleavage system H protein
MSSIPAQLKYTKEHEWIQEISPTKFRIGITDYAQNGASVNANSVCGEVESTKSVSEIYAPISGKVVLVNDKLESNPEIINSDPYGAGWIAEIEISTDSLQEVLLSAQEYQSLTA